jgi:tetratricopeptide (TPR) repeat protein
MDVNKLQSRKRLRRMTALASSVSGALVVLLAFLIPSMQDQWDRFQSRQVIERYVNLGKKFMKEKHYQIAENAFQKAFELSESRRLDIDELRLQAHIQLINQNPYWRNKPPADLKEIDFEYLLGLQTDKAHAKDRAVTLGVYGCYLVSLGRFQEARQAFDEAIKLNPNSGENYINYANLLDDQGDQVGAEKAYLKGLALDPKDAFGHFNFALLLEREKRNAESLTQLEIAYQLAPEDKDIREQLQQARPKNK